MAVYAEITSNIEYILAGGDLNGCVNGGEDFKTLSGDNTLTETLLIRGWAGDNISSACKIKSVMLDNLETRIRTSIGTVSTDKFKLVYGLKPYYGSASGIDFNKTSEGNGAKDVSYTVDNSSDWKNFSGFEVNITDDVKANNSYLGLTLEMTKLGTLKTRAYFKNIRLRVVRTRACYVSFVVDGVNAKTIMYDYGTVPSFGSTPTRTGYVFKGWKSSADSATYSGTLPTAYETDVTYTAVWNPTYTLTVTATAGGTATGGGTYETGSSVTIKATPNTGYKFVKWSDGNTNATRTVAVTADITYTAYFEIDKINKIYVGTSQSKSIYIGTSEAKSIYVGTTKVYG